MPRKLVAYLAGLLAERRAHGTRVGSRALSCWWPAVFALVWFCERRPVPLVGAGLGISPATSYRYLAEAIGVLATQALDLHQALNQVKAEGWSHVVLDGTVVSCDQLEDRQHERHDPRRLIFRQTGGFGGNGQAVMRLDGPPAGSRLAPWLGPRPDRHLHPPARRAVLGSLPAAPAHPGRRRRHRRAHPVKTPAGAASWTPTPRLVTCSFSLRCLGERGFAMLAGRWRTLQHVTVSPNKTGKIT